MLTLTNRIDMRPGAVPLVIHLGQYDSDFTLVFELYSSAGNFTVESGTTAMIRGTKTDGHAYDADATIDVSAKTVTVAGSEQMTAAKGRNVYELVLTKSGKVLSTANFILDVERAAMDAETIASESVLKELNAIIAGAETATDAAADAASAADRAEDAAESVSSASTQIATNTADIADLKADLKQKTGLSEEAKIALLDCFEHVAWIDEHGQTYYDNLHDALYPDTGLDHITAAFAQGSLAVYPSTPLNDLKPYLTVTGYYKDGSTARIEDYALSGTLTVGTSTVTVISEGKTATFNVAVTEDGVQSISAVYNSNELILAVDPISKLRNGLTVTANYTDGTKETVTDYTLSGTLVSGTNNIKVTYRDKETTFNISVPASHYLTSNDIESSYGVNVSIDATGTPTHVSTAEAFFAILFKSNVVKFRTKLTEWLDQSHFTMVVYKNSSSNNVYGIDPGTVSQYVPTERCKLTLKSGNNGYDKESDYTDTIIESFTPVHDWPAVLIPYADTDVVFELTSGKITISDVYGNEICSVNATNANRLGYWGSFYLIGTYFTNIVIIDS